jgi:hypothetical protein
MARRGVAGIFGEHTVDVDLDPQNCAWTVKATDGRVLMQVPWTWAYDQAPLGKRVYHRKHFLTNDEYVAHSSRWEAFEMSMCAYPLTSEDKRLLEARFPGITTKQQYVVADPIWQPEPRSRTTPAPRRNRTPTPTPLPEDVLSPPAQPPATTTPETAHEAGERKLLL